MKNYAFLTALYASVALHGLVAGQPPRLQLTHMLFQSILAGDTSRACELVTLGAADDPQPVRCVNVPTTTGGYLPHLMHPLGFATFCNNTVVMEALLHRGCNPDQPIVYRDPLEPDKRKEISLHNLAERYRKKDALDFLNKRRQHPTRPEGPDR